MRSFKGILFDLDGTLVDTAPDLAAALNHVLRQEKKPALPLSVIRQAASDGAQGLLKLGFQIQADHPTFPRLKEKFLEYYQSHIHHQSFLFEGMEKILRHCVSHKIPWGIVTNKPTYLTEKLLKKLKLDQLAGCIVCGDTLKQKKPHPAPLIYAANLLKLTPTECCYIGDAERDMIAARACNMLAIAALYGYLSQNTDSSTWQADHYVNSPKELWEILF